MGIKTPVRSTCTDVSMTHSETLELIRFMYMPGFFHLAIRFGMLKLAMLSRALATKKAEAPAQFVRLFIAIDMEELASLRSEFTIGMKKTRAVLFP